MQEDTLNHFHRNSRLFTALGVFGAMSVYFTQLQLNTRWQRLGIVSSLTIFLLIALAIQRNLPPESSDYDPFDYAINVLPKQPENVVFYVAFWFLVFSVAGIIIRYSSTFLFLVQFVVFLVGFALAHRLVRKVYQSFNEKTSENTEIQLGVGHLPIVLSLHSIRNALYAAILGGGGLAFTWMWNLFVWEQFIAFKSPSFHSAVLVGLFAGLAIGGIVFTLLNLGIIILHYQTALIRKRDLESEAAQFLQKLGFNVENNSQES